ncbi:hypothetical protein GCM10009414_20960 [Tatumella terrea]|uniref:hypothetical protein n=1 Tax=Tatumella TaxID=82986 RepID=UPI001BAF0A14|nr:hypothetical protein [Tatumella sp. JGM118]MBS0909185.1 hypothetical protein [Tatumella sp. JGM118]
MDESKGCGKHINPNGSDLRCGQKEFSPLSGFSAVILCHNCQMIRRLEAYQSAFYRLQNKGPKNG